jgi:hypothetical protein
MASDRRKMCGYLTTSRSGAWRAGRIRSRGASAAVRSPDRPPLLTWRDIGRGTRRSADELIATEAESTALEALRTATGEVHGDMERHTMRQYLIAERIADMRGVAYDRELLLCASFLHDSGLYGPASTGDVYIKDSARYARRTLEPLGWPEHRLRVCLDGLRAAPCVQNAVVAAQRGGLGTQRECLEMLGCCGKDRVRMLNEIVAANVLCGELSLGSAIVAEAWVQAHDLLRRNRP